MESDSKKNRNNARFLLQALRRLDIEDLFFLGETVGIRRSELEPGNIIRLSVSLTERARIAGRERQLTQALRQEYPAVWAVVRRTGNLEGSPFRGLVPLGVGDRDRFFGRDAEIEELKSRIEGPTRTDFILIVGASGSGKSSLVGAGLLPALIEDENIPWIWGRFAPGNDHAGPLAGLAGAVTRAFDWTGPRYLDNKKKTQAAISQPNGLLDLIEGNLKDHQRLLIWIDQFEEIFTGLSRAQRGELLRELFSLAGERIRLIGTLRAEFYHRCLEERDHLLPKLEGAHFPLGLPDEPGLAAIIQRPLESAGYEIEPELLGRLIADTGTEPGNLALLAFALEDTYRRFRRDESGSEMVRAQHYLGLKTVLGRRAESVLEGFAKAEVSAFEKAFSHLVDLAPDRPPTRRRADREVLRSQFPQASPVFDALIESRLVVSNQEEGNRPTLEVAHEALLQYWQRIQGLIERMRNDLFLRNLFERETSLWLNADRSADNLVLHGSRLEQATDWLERVPHFAAQLAPQARSRGQHQLKTVGIERRLEIPSLDSGSWTTAAIASEGSHRAIVGNNAGEVLLVDLEKAELLNLCKAHQGRISAVAISPDGQRAITADQEQTLLWDVHRSEPILELRGHSAAVHQAIFSRDGSQALTLAKAYDQAIRDENRVYTELLWDPETGSRGVFPGYGGGCAVSGTFSHDAELWASIGPSIRIWDLQSGRNKAVISSRVESFSSACFSECGTRLLCTSLDGVARLVDPHSGSDYRVFPAVGKGLTLTAGVLSAKGHRCATAASDGTLTFWEMDTEEPIAQVTGTGSRVALLELCGQDQLVLTVSCCCEITIYEFSTGQKITSRKLAGVSTLAAQLDFNQTRLLTLTEASCELWEILPKLSEKTSAGHQVGSISEYIQACVSKSERDEQQALSRSHRTLEYQSRFLSHLGRRQVDMGFPVEGMGLALEALPSDFSAPDRPFIWEAETALYYGLTHCRETAYLETDAYHYESHFSNDGKLLLSAYGDDVARIWDIEKRSILTEFKGHSDNIRFARFNHDCSLVATGSEDATVRIWDSRSGRELYRFEGHSSAIDSLMFHASRDWVLSVGGGTAALWDATSGPLLWTGGKDESLTGAVLSPQKGTRIFLYGKAHGRMLDGSTFEEIAFLSTPKPKAGLCIPRFCNSEKLLAVPMEDSKVGVYDGKSGKLLGLLGQSKTFIRFLRFDAAGKRLLIGAGDHAEVWDPYDQRCLAVLDHSDSVSDGVFDHEGKLIITVSSDGGHASVWDTESWSKLKDLNQTSRQVKHLSIDPANRILLAYGTKGAHLWDLHKEGESRLLGTPGETAHTVLFSPDGRYAAILLRDRGYRLIETATHSTLDLERFQPINGVLFDRESRNVSFIVGNALKIIQLDDFKVRYIRFDQRLKSMQLPARRDRLLVASEHSVYMVSLKTDQILGRLDLEGEEIQSVGIGLEDAYLVVATDRNRLRFYEADRGKALAEVQLEQEPYLNRIVVSPVEDLAVTVSFSTLYFWKLSTAELLDVVNESCDAVAFSKDGRELITAHYRTLSVWDTSERYKKKSIQTPEQFSNAKIIPELGLISVVSEGQLQVWDLASGGMKAVVGRDEGDEKISDGAVSETGDYLLTSYWNAQSKLWPFFKDVQSLVHHAQRHLPRELDDESRRSSLLPARRAEGRKR